LLGETSVNDAVTPGLKEPRLRKGWGNPVLGNVAQVGVRQVGANAISPERTGHMDGCATAHEGIKDDGGGTRGITGTGRDPAGGSHDVLHGTFAVGPAYLLGKGVSR